MKNYYFSIFFVICFIEFFSCTNETDEYYLTPNNAVLEVSAYSGSIETVFTFDASESAGAVEYYFSTGEDGTQNFIRASSSQTSHKYSIPGVYNVELKTVDKDGYEYFDNRIVEVYVNVENTAPNPTIEMITLNQDYAYYEFVVHEDVDVETPQQFLSYKWKITGPYTDTLISDFTVGEYKISYIFPIEGSYTVELSVMDPEGLMSTVEETFSISNPIKILDERDGKVYDIIILGNLKIMAENFAYESPNSSWYNDSIKYEDFGRLYTRDDAIASAPKGWRLPTENEFLMLVDSTTGDIATAGGELKSVGDWASGTGTDPLSFSAIPSGYALYNTSQEEYVFYYMNTFAVFWSFDREYSHTEYFILIDGNDYLLYEEQDLEYASLMKLSVRYVQEIN